MFWVAVRIPALLVYPHTLPLGAPRWWQHTASLGEWVTFRERLSHSSHCVLKVKATLL